MRLFHYLQNKVDVINKALPFVFIIYFLGVFIPNISGAIGFSAINGGLIKIVWRVFFALILGIYIGICLISNKVSIKRPLLFLVGIIFIVLLLSPILNIKNATNTQSLTNGNVQNVFEFRTGYISVLAFIGNDVFFAFLLVAGLFLVFPVAIKGKKSFFIFLYFYVVLMIVLSFVSFFIDKEFYLKILHLDFSSIYSEKGLSSLFPSKNTFGLFLFSGLCVCFVLIKEDLNRFIRISSIIVTILFSIIILFTFCKSSIFSMLVFYVSLLLIATYKKRKKKPYLFIISIVVIAAFLIFLLLVLTVPALHKSGILAYLYNLLSNSSGSMVGRLSLVAVFFENFGSSHIIFGYGPYLSNTVFSWINNVTTDFSLDNLHNSFLMVLANGGIFYLFLYIFLICYSINICIHIKNNSLKSCLIATMAGFILYSLFESNILFLSGSSGTFIASFLLSSYAISNSTLGEDKVEEYQINV